MIMISDADGLDSFLRRVFVYRPENEEIVRTPEFMVNQLRDENKIEGDCDDIATLIASVATAVNLPCHFVALDSKNQGLDHVFSRIFTTRWITVDPTVERGTDYNVFDAIIVPVNA